MARVGDGLNVLNVKGGGTRRFVHDVEQFAFVRARKDRHEGTHALLMRGLLEVLGPAFDVGAAVGLALLLAGWAGDDPVEDVDDARSIGVAHVEHAHQVVGHVGRDGGG